MFAELDDRRAYECRAWPICDGRLPIFANLGNIYECLTCAIFDFMLNLMNIWLWVANLFFLPVMSVQLNQSWPYGWEAWAVIVDRCDSKVINLGRISVELVQSWAYDFRAGGIWYRIFDVLLLSLINLGPMSAELNQSWQGWAIATSQTILLCFCRVNVLSTAMLYCHSNSSGWRIRVC